MTPPDSARGLIIDSVERAHALAAVTQALFDDQREASQLGRYLLIEQRGAGSMGIVFAAYDPQLDRKVALKLLRRPTSESLGEAMRAGILREARAMARLSHPNVVTVHEVGEEDDRIFLAMEYVAGGTIRDWIEQGPHPWKATVELLIAAGRGLKAAHDAGLVHRDFKPENVMLTEAGVPRVADFGLARMGEHADLETLPGTDHRDPLLTGGGAGAVGTPAYMAPEVFAGQPADARSDQFSFCVVLFEALFGRRPFPGEDIETLRTNVEQGRAQEPDDLRDVPTPLQEIVARGLAADPEERFADIGSLLDALQASTQPPRRRVWPWLAVGLLCAAGLAFAFRTTSQNTAMPTQGAVCEGGTQRVAEVWSPESRKELTANLTGSEAERTQFLELGNEYAITWAEAHRESCLDSAVRKVQSTARLDSRMLCLDGRLRAFSGALRALEGDDGVELATAAKALRTLPSIEGCADARRHSDGPAPSNREATLAIEEELGRARALERVRNPEQAIEIVEELVPRARTLGDSRLLVRTLLTLSSMEIRSGQAGRATSNLEAARVEAERAGLDDLLVEALTMQATDAVMQSDTKQARRDLDVAAAILERYGGDPKLEPAIEGRKGVVAYHSGDLEAAVGHYRKQLAALEAAGVAHDATGVSALSNLGLALRDLGREGEALESMTESRKRCVALDGPQNPQLPNIDLNIAMVLFDLSRYPEALDVLERGLEVLNATRGPKSIDAVQMHAGFSLVHEGLGNYEKSLEHALQGIEILEHLEQADHPDMAMCQSSAGAALVRMGRPGEGLARHRIALEIYEASYGPDDPEVATTLVQVALAQDAAGDLEGAVASLERSLEIRIKAQQPRHFLGDSRRKLARALQHIDPSRSERLAREALEDFRESPFEDPVMESDLENLLSELGAD